MSAPKDQSIRQLYELICLINTNKELKRKAGSLRQCVQVLPKA
jgi:hypothetical protein